MISKAQKENFRTLKNSLNQRLKAEYTKERGHFSTAAARSSRLNQMIQELHNLGYRNLSDVKDLKTRHINALAENFVERIDRLELNSGTVKNRMTDLRWLAENINKANIINASNDFYKIDRRQYVNNDINPAKRLEESDLSKIKDENLKLSLRLQSEFGLRREESIKFRPDCINLKENRLDLEVGTKGGRYRAIPILTESQKTLLKEVSDHCRATNAKSLIPNDLSYRQQLRRYDYQTAQADMYKNHGFRHQYAQDRYRELTKMDCPKNGGLRSKQLSHEQKELDYEARMIIAEELGHGREDVTAVYLGR